ncbi:MAG: hypothetical protein K6G10_06885 [Butyrivibrio sp.]|nr:hypothetical protein [Butyrivibrio sp.]
MEKQLKITDHKGIEYPSLIAKCNAYNINKTTYLNRIKRGWSEESALTTAVRTMDLYTEDHLGNKFKNAREMCKHYKISYAAFNGRMKAGWNLDMALTTPAEKRKSKAAYVKKDGYYVDPWGGRFKTKSEMAEAHELNLQVLTHRLAQDWTLEEALSIKLNGKRFPDKKRTITPPNKHLLDPWGMEHRSYKAMAEYHGIPPSVLIDRLGRDWPLEKALTTPILGKNDDYHGKECCDHTGRHFTSKEKMLRFWGITKSAYQSRLKKGWTLEKALTTPVRQKKQSITYNGVVYDKLSDFCKEYGITLGTYYNQRKLGWTLDRIVNDLGNGCFKPCKDPWGNPYDSINEMLSAYNVSYSMYHQRLEDGWTLEEILLIPSKGIYISHYRKLFKMDGEEHYSFKCPTCGKEHIFTKSEIRQHFLIHVKNKEEP